jgi:hypothetical protein
MSANPVLRLVESPVSALADLGWACVILAALVGTWWAAGRNLLWLDQQWRTGWQILPPLGYAARTVALLLVVAVDLWLLAALVAVLA